MFVANFSSVGLPTKQSTALYSAVWHVGQSNLNFHQNHLRPCGYSHNHKTPAPPPSDHPTISDHHQLSSPATPVPPILSASGRGGGPQPVAKKISAEHGHLKPKSHHEPFIATTTANKIVYTQLHGYCCALLTILLGTSKAENLPIWNREPQNKKKLISRILQACFQVLQPQSPSRKTRDLRLLFQRQMPKNRSSRRHARVVPLGDAQVAKPSARKPSRKIATVELGTACAAQAGAREVPRARWNCAAFWDLVGRC